jgi:hypothetical protein
MQIFKGLLMFAAGALLSGAVALAERGSGSDQIRPTSRSDGTAIYGIRPTGVGLPLIGVQKGSVGAGDYVVSLKTYHDGGAYDADLAAVGKRASDFLVRRLRGLATARRRCLAAARRERRPTRRCRQPTPAITLDIDETAISNYRYFAEKDFKDIGAAFIPAILDANSPPIRPTLRLFDLAKRRGVAPFFITGRVLKGPAALNLRRAGYSGWRGLILDRRAQPMIPYKSAARAKLEERGFRIIVNVGDQESDLAGGHADRAFKLPNPFYFTP